MAEVPANVVGFTGVDTTTDPYVLGRIDPRKSSLAYNFRMKQGIRKMRGGWDPVLDFASSKYPVKSGVYFPWGSKAIVPWTGNTISGSFTYEDTFYLPEQIPFTVEFWLKADNSMLTRDICRIPVDFTDEDADYTSHMRIFLLSTNDMPSPTHPNVVHLACEIMVELSGTPYRVVYYDVSPITLDGTWGHHAVMRPLAGGTPLSHYTGGGATSTNMTAQIGASEAGYDMITDAQLLAQDAPNYYNHMEIGGGEMCVSDFRVWADVRTQQEIIANYNTQLAGTETELVLYVPFDEGEGKVFSFYQPKKDGYDGSTYQGYFAPQEPWVNDDDELVFTGYKCMAYPSLRAKWTEDVTGDPATDHRDENEDASYDGGILWDTALLVGTGGPDYNDNGIWFGVAQLKIRLRQLKEGVICGRLGMRQGSTGYHLFLLNDNEAEAYVSTKIFDESDIQVVGGTEKAQVITVIYDGTAATIGGRCKFYLDNSDVTQTSPSAHNSWSSGDEIHDTIFPPWNDPDTTADSLEEPDGAIGGSTVDENMCIAFDLIWMRQWYDKFPADLTTAAMVAATYTLDELPSQYCYLVDGISGYISSYTNTAVLTNSENVWDIDVSGSTNFMNYIRMPLQNAEKEYTTSTAELTHLVVNENSADRLIKQDVMVKKIVDWLADTSTQDDEIQILRDDAHTPLYVLKPWTTQTAPRVYFNGATISNLANYFTSDTFKKNKIARNILKTTEGTVTEGGLSYTRNELKIFEAIEDDSPLQSIETLGANVYKSRYLLLALEDRNTTTYGQRSHKIRWCDAPLDLVPTTLPAIRGFFRYKSEDEDVDKLLVYSWNNAWTLATDELERNDWGWIERNDDKGINFIVANNKMVAMDSKQAIKLNHKGDFSRLGIERPVDISVAPEKATALVFVFENDYYQFGYAAQYYDSVNGALSGTIPIFSDLDQSFIYVTGGDPNALHYIEVTIKTCKDKNIDQVKIWRTLNLDDTGTETELFLTNISSNSRQDSENVVFRDTWLSTELINQPFLPARYVGDDIVPIPCVAMDVAFERLFLFGSEEDSATLFWSDVDSLGLAVPDQFPSLNALIIEEGETTKGTALAWYLSVLFAFKENAIFKIQETAAGSFRSQLIYKGAGALNQRCVRLVANDVFFLDKSGLYTIGFGQPTFLSMPLVDYFKNNVDTDQAKEKAFILYDKVDRSVLCFVPSTDSTYCDRCIVYDLDTKMFTIDLVPDVTCGYVDDEDIYLGSPYGQIFKYNRSGTVDGVDSTSTGTATSFDSTSMTKTGGGFGTDRALQGVPVFVVDTDEHQIWKGIITSHTDTVLTVDEWEQMFNCTADPDSTNTLTYYIGYIYLYNKSPIYTMMNTQWEKQLASYELVTNLVSGIPLYYKLSFNHGDDTHTKAATITGDVVRTHEFQGMHRNMQMEFAMVVNSQVDVKETTLHAQWTRGAKDI